MPIYDYECKSCGIKFDVFARISDPPTDVCPKCGEHQVNRLISGTCGTVEMSSKEYFRNVIEPEAKKIAQKINNGDEDALADIIGEDKM